MRVDQSIRLSERVSLERHGHDGTAAWTLSVRPRVQSRIGERVGEQAARSTADEVVDEAIELLQAARERKS